jgi:hypothetical protein
VEAGQDAGPDCDVYEGDLLELAPATFIDAEPADTHEALIGWGDGTAEPGIVDETAGTISGSHVYADNGVYTVTVIVWDDDMAGPGPGAVPGVDFVEDTFTVTVSNVAPTITEFLGPDWRSASKRDPPRRRIGPHLGLWVLVGPSGPRDRSQVSRGR